MCPSYLTGPLSLIRTSFSAVLCLLLYRKPKSLPLSFQRRDAVLKRTSRLRGRVSLFCCPIGGCSVGSATTHRKTSERNGTPNKLEAVTHLSSAARRREAFCMRFISSPHWWLRKVSRTFIIVCACAIAACEGQVSEGTSAAGQGTVVRTHLLSLLHLWSDYGTKARRARVRSLYHNTMQMLSKPYGRYRYSGVQCTCCRKCKRYGATHRCQHHWQYFRVRPHRPQSRLVLLRVRQRKPSVGLWLLRQLGAIIREAGNSI